MLNWTFLLSIGSILVLAIIAWWFIPNWQAKKLNGRSGLTAKDIAELEDAYRKTVTQALGGIILLLTATVAFQQLNETRRNSEAQLRETARTTDINTKNQLLAKGFELLARASSAERLSGILILHDWAERSSKDDTSTTESRYTIYTPALIGFVRDVTRFTISTEICEEFGRPTSEMISTEVQAALDILKKRSITNPQVLNFRGLNLSHANLSAMNLSGSNFAFADLSEADLSKANLKNANFYCTNLYRANLAGTDLSGNTNLAGALLLKANLGKADGKATSLADANLVKATLSEAILEETDLRGARLWESNFFRTKLINLKVDDQTDLDRVCLVETMTTATPLHQTKNYDKAVKAESGNALASDSWCAPKLKTEAQTPMVR
jgi:hypothetical protein